MDDREKEIKAPNRRHAEPPAKKTKADQVPAASLDADDPLEGDSSDSDDSDDDTAALLAELNKIKKERAIEQAKKVLLFKMYQININHKVHHNFIRVKFSFITQPFRCCLLIIASFYIVRIVV